MPDSTDRAVSTIPEADKPQSAIHAGREVAHTNMQQTRCTRYARRVQAAYALEMLLTWTGGAVPRAGGAVSRTGRAVAGASRTVACSMTESVKNTAR